MSTVEEQQPGSSAADFFECKMFAEPEDDDGEAGSQDANDGLAIIDHGYGEDTEAATSFATSFTSSWTSAEPLRSESKPPRSPPSPSDTRYQKRRAPVGGLTSGKDLQALMEKTHYR